MAKYYLDKRFVVTGQRSHVNLDNYLSLDKAVRSIVGSGGSGSTAGSGMTDDVPNSFIDLGGLLTKDAIIDTNTTFEFGVQNIRTKVAYSTQLDLTADPDFGGIFDGLSWQHESDSGSGIMYLIDDGAGTPFAGMKTVIGGGVLTKSISLGDVEAVMNIVNTSLNTSTDITATSEVARMVVTNNTTNVTYTVQADEASEEVILQVSDNVGGNSATIAVVLDQGNGVPGIELRNLPVADDEGQALALGLNSNTVYRTTGGALRIKL